MHDDRKDLILNGEPLYSTSETSVRLKELGVQAKPGTLRTWRWEGKGPAYILDANRPRYPESEIRAFVASRRSLPPKRGQHAA
jgi:hypothetical protein